MHTQVFPVRGDAGANTTGSRRSVKFMSASSLTVDAAYEVCVSVYAGNEVVYTGSVCRPVQGHLG
jgi:hypothetical protein